MRGIVAMMKSLRTEIVVDGIETRRQLEFVRALDCEYCQGFLIGRSMDIARPRALLAEGVPI